MREVTFKKDFGPWKKGQYVSNIRFDFSCSTITEYNDVGKAIRTVRIGLIALEEISCQDS